MAKKNKKIIKINNQIRTFFDDDPFDVGVERVGVETLSDLFHTLGIYDVDYNKKDMLKTIRQRWSTGDVTFRQDILNFFKSLNHFYKSDKLKEPNLDRSQKIDSILEELDATQEEAVLLYESFMEIRSKKITIAKVESKLKHIRFDFKKQKLQKALDGFFDLNDSLEFNASIKYELFEQCFHKIVTLNTKSYEFEFLQEGDFDEIVEKITQDKEQVVAKKQYQTEVFLSSLTQNHPYLSKAQIVSALRASPPKSNFNYPVLSTNVLDEIISKYLHVSSVELHDVELFFTVKSSFTLPYTDILKPYTLDIHMPAQKMLRDIWCAKELDFKETIANAKQEHEENFLRDLKYIVGECANYATLFNFTDEELHHKVYEHLLESIPASLVLNPKIIRKTIKRFIFSIHEELIKKQRQALLARTIRDFKNLFPLARGLRRKLTLHIGPTNSGKTYTAMKQLQEADTGYYLAPLRLLALEGYESLKEQGVDSSLITGEEQILDEDATHISSTIEMLNFEVDVDVCVIDEVQMIDDRDRGWAWANAIIGAPAKEIIMTGSINAKEAIVALAEYLGEELEIIEFERKNPLTLLEVPTKPKDVQTGTAIIAFSRKDVLRLKQNFSRFFSVSVVYGNLSPEVRREEARRFRAGETQVLIATDAIAMGMNLPIKTILFSKADKFDGITQRNLLPSEIHQISGRAGRFGLSEEGFVGALSIEVLDIIKKNFPKAARVIAVPFNVMANLEHIKLVGNILEESSLGEILKFFVTNMKFDGPFRASNLSDMMEAAFIVDGYDLDLATKYHLACAPLTLKSPYIVSAYESYIVALEQKRLVHYIPAVLVGGFAQTAEDLLRAEDMVKEISLYLWLSYRFKEYFVDEKKARQYRGVINSFIEQSLQQSHFVQRCKMCQAPLPLNSKYSICQSCFRKNYARKRRRGGRAYGQGK